MTHPHTTHLSTRPRLLCGLALLLGLCIMLGGLARPAHAQSTLSVTNCSSDAQLQAAVAQANSDNAGDVITFACSGDIKLSSTLKINGSMTLDGSGQSVTLDGGDSMQVLNVTNSATSFTTFTLNALTVAHGWVGNLGIGAGLRNNDSKVSISNSTFAYNSATIAGGGGVVGNFGAVSFSGSIVAANTSGDCGQFTGGFPGTITDQGYNLSSDSSCSFTGTGSVQNTNPKLGPLASNGGPTQTLALQQGSPASDQLPLATCPATDQRGVSRPDTGESSCDMGAYEFDDSADKDLGLSNLPADLTVNATSPQGAVVPYTLPTVVDESGESSTASVSCTPASGSTFAIGTTKVTCTASDSDDTNSPVSGSFQVTVKGAAAQVKDLVTMVNGDHLSSSLQNALDNKLQDVQTAITAGQTATACSELTDFSGYVQSHTGKGISSSQATQLMAAARQVQAVLGC